MAKSNIEFLRDILGKSEFESPLMSEAIEFIDAIEEEQTEYDDEIKSLKKEINDKEDELDDRDDIIESLRKDIQDLEDNPSSDTVFLGLDTITYQFEKGNLKIQSQFEHWCEQVKKQNAVVPA